MSNMFPTPRPIPMAGETKISIVSPAVRPFFRVRGGGKCVLMSLHRGSKRLTTRLPYPASRGGDLSIFPPSAKSLRSQGYGYIGPMWAHAPVGPHPVGPHLRAHTLVGPQAQAKRFGPTAGCILSIFPPSAKRLVFVAPCGPTRVWARRCGPTGCGPTGCGPAPCGPTPCGPTRCGPTPCGPTPAGPHPGGPTCPGKAV